MRYHPENVRQSPEQDSAEVPGDLGPYRFERRLGSGGMGEVFLAFDRRLGRRVAIKRLRSDLDATRGRERLRREARAAARLSHSAIVFPASICPFGASSAIGRP